MKSNYLIFRLIGPLVILTLSFFNVIDGVIGDWLGYYYYPISFGLAIGLFNMKRVGSVFLNFSYTLLISIATFSFVMLLLYIVSATFNSTEIMNTRIFKTIVFLISPILVLSSYFKFYKISFSKFLILSTIVSATIIFIYALLEPEINLENEVIKTLLNPYLIWQLVVAFAMQMVLYQKDILRTSTSRTT